MKLRNSALVWTTLAAACLLASPAMADTKIHAEFTADYDRLRPEPYPGIHLKNTLEVTLSGVNQVRESTTRQTGKLSDHQGGTKILGQKSSDGGSVWHVAGPNRLERVVNHPQSVITMVIEVSDATCKLQVQYKLKPGFTEYMFKQIRNGKMGYFTEPKVSSTTCTIR